MYLRAERLTLDFPLHSDDTGHAAGHY